MLHIHENLKIIWLPEIRIHTVRPLNDIEPLRHHIPRILRIKIHRMIVERSVMHHLTPLDHIQHFPLETLVVNITANLQQTLLSPLMTLQIEIIHVKKIPAKLPVKVFCNCGFSGSGAPVNGNDETVIACPDKFLYRKDCRQESLPVPNLPLSNVTHYCYPHLRECQPLYNKL